MSINDTILIKNYKFTILKRDGLRVLLAWTEKSGESKERWVIVNKKALQWLL